MGRNIKFVFMIVSLCMKKEILTINSCRQQSCVENGKCILPEMLISNTSP